jgi:hypothetical protein
LAQAPLHLQKLEGFGVAAALEEMAELGIDSRRQGLFQTLDSFGDFAETFHVTVRIAAALFVGDDCEALAECVGESG